MRSRWKRPGLSAGRRRYSWLWSSCAWSRKGGSERELRAREEGFLVLPVGATGAATGERGMAVACRELDVAGGVPVQAQVPGAGFGGRGRRRGEVRERGVVDV